MINFTQRGKYDNIKWQWSLLILIKFDFYLISLPKIQLYVLMKYRNNSKAICIYIAIYLLFLLYYCFLIYQCSNLQIQIDHHKMHQQQTAKHHLLVLQRILDQKYKKNTRYASLSIMFDINVMKIIFENLLNYRKPFSNLLTKVVLSKLKRETTDYNAYNRSRSILLTINRKDSYIWYIMWWKSCWILKSRCLIAKCLAFPLPSKS